MNKVLFLDVDGVLNSANWFRSISPRKPSASYTEYKESQIDPGAVAQLNRILDVTGCDVVVSSTWRKSISMPTLLTILTHRGLDQRYCERFVGYTPVGDYRHRASGLWITTPRGFEIQLWMTANEGSCERLAILDDDSDMEHLLPFLVQTDGVKGLDAKAADAVIDILMSED